MTEEEKRSIIDSANAEEEISPALQAGDIVWWPPGRISIEAGESLKLKYNGSTWEEHTDQVYTLGT